MTKFIPDFVAAPGPAEQRIINFYPTFDLPITFISAVVLLCTRRFLSKNVFYPLGRRNGLEKLKLQRFAENAWFSVYYIVEVIMGFYVLWQSEWLWNPIMTYTNYPYEHQQDFSRPELYGLRVYYLISCGFYIQALYGLLFIDERMKDFGEMLTHHIITVALIAFSIVSSYHRAGSVVILLHDVVDVFLYSAKACHESNKTNVANFLFGLFVLSFFCSSSSFVTNFCFQCVLSVG